MPDLASSTFILPKAAQPTADQRRLTADMLAFIRAHADANPSAVYVLHGDAGSGKSAALAHVFTQLQAAARSADSADPLQGRDNYLLVNHNEMLKVYKEVAVAEPVLRKRDFVKPTPFINAMRKRGRKADVVFVDEAHLLLSQSDPFNKFTGDNQLDAILQLARVVVLVFDPQQVVKLKSHWDVGMLKRHLRGHAVREFQLDGQLRVQDAAVSAWINDFVNGQLRPLPQPKQFDLRVFADGQPLYAWVQARDREFGLARLIATSDFPFRVYTDRTWYVDAGSLHLPWDKINFTDRPWAERPETLHEVGSIYTIQGFDLSYAGVILGPSVDYDPRTDQIVTAPARFEDSEAFRKHPGLPDPEAVKQAIIMHTVNILLKRGRQGLGIYAVQPRLRQRLLELSGQSIK